jgi:hopanoid biosynthesis associated protein HpnK
MKHLIINADDFGMAGAVNAGIIRGHREGIITSASLLAGGAAAEEAAALAKDNPGLGVGVHLCLTIEKAVSFNLPGLAPDSILPPSPLAFMVKWLTGRISRDEVRRELKAQIDRAVFLGITPTHLDGHQHIHVMPGVFREVAALAREYGIKAVRCPVGPSSGLEKGFGKAVEKIILEGFARYGSGAVRANSLRHPDYFFGLAQTGSVDAGWLAKLVEGLPDGTSEIMCHPGIRDDNTARRLDWGHGWQGELDAVTDPRVKELIEGRGIRLVNFSQI